MGYLDEWRHCPRCGAPVEPRDGRAECAECTYVAYANPAPAACALCVDEAGRILLTRRAWEPYAGMWDLPGGFLQEDEHPLDALRRELAEETGLAGAVPEVVAETVDTFPSGATWRTRWVRMEWVEGEPQTAAPEEVNSWAWYAWEALPAPLFLPMASLVADGYNPF